MSEGRANPFVQLMLARLREFVREPEVLFWVFGFPVLLALGLGIAFRDRPPEKVFVGVLNGPGAREIVAALAHDAVFDTRLLDANAAAHELRMGRVALVVVPGTPVEYRFDPGRPDSATARRQVDDALQRAAGRHDAFDVKEKHVAEPGARYIDFLIPGLLGMNIMSGSMWGVGYSLAEMRVRKLLKRLVATPMSRNHFLGAMMVSRMLIVFLEVVLMLIFGWLVFGMAVRGTWLGIAAISVVGGFSFTGLGLFVACRAKKTETVTGLMNLAMLPMFVFSGVFFSSERFPAMLQPVIRALPLTALNDALRAVILEGTPLMAQPGRLLVLALWGVVSFVLALRFFRWS